MASRWTNNHNSGTQEVELDVVCEQDDGWFIAIIDVYGDGDGGLDIFTKSLDEAIELRDDLNTAIEELKKHADTA